MTKLTNEEAISLLQDRIWRLNHLYKIKTKDRKLQTIKLNRAQNEYLVNETNRDIILKARQLGFSTLKLLELLDFVLFNKNANAVMIAHLKDKVQVLFEIVRLAYEHFPNFGGEFQKPKASYDNRNEIYFPSLNSKIYVALDTRGETIHNLHISELAYMENAEEKMLGILESVPKNGIISFESTANGTSGYFYQTWEDQRSEFNKHFYPWTFDIDYTEETYKSFEELIQEYIPLQIQYELIPEIWNVVSISKEQFAWYIAKIRRHREKVKQEYPTIALEAFVASGRNIFSFSDLQKHPIKDPIDRKYRDLLIWEHPLPGVLYSIGCDPSEGVGKDNAVIEVLNAHTGEQCAELATSFIPPDELSGYLVEIGTYYNKALITLEINNTGTSTRDHLKRKYANLYRRQVFDKVSNSYTEQIGWRTSSITKPKLVDSLEEALRNQDILLHSYSAVSELKTFVRTDEQGKKGYGAEGSNKDDRVIALGLAVQGISQLPRMKKPETIAQKRLKEYIQGKQLESILPKDSMYRGSQYDMRKQKYNLRKI